MSAPDRIWTYWDSAGPGFTESDPKDKRYPEYIRADLVPQWQPIETAPRDGTIIDVWLGDADMRDVEFYCTHGTRRSPGWWFSNGKFRPLGGLEPAMTVFVTPTHWMPLPNPPEDK